MDLDLESTYHPVQESLPLLKTKVVLGGSNGGNSPVAQPDWERRLGQKNREYDVKPQVVELN